MNRGAGGPRRAATCDGDAERRRERGAAGELRDPRGERRQRGGDARRRGEVEFQVRLAGPGERDHGTVETERGRLHGLRRIRQAVEERPDRPDHFTAKRTKTGSLSSGALIHSSYLRPFSFPSGCGK